MGLPDCRFELAGHVAAIAGQTKGRVEVEVYNPQNDDGSAAPPIAMFYDDTVSMTVPYKGRLREIGYAGTLTPAQRTSCGATLIGSAPAQTAVG